MDIWDEILLVRWESLKLLRTMVLNLGLAYGCVHYVFMYIQRRCTLLVCLCYLKGFWVQVLLHNLRLV